MAKNVTESVDVQVTEIFGCPVVRRYVKTIGKGEKIDDSESHSLHFLRAIPLVMFFSTILSIGLVVAILYHPPPLVEEFTKSVLSLGKSNTLELEEKLKDLEEEIKRLKNEGFENFTREEQLRGKLSSAQEKNVVLSKKLSAAGDHIKSLETANANKERKIMDAKHDFGICMGEKTDLKKQESDTKSHLEKCTSSVRHLSDKITKLQSKTTEQLETIKEANNTLDELEKDFDQCRENLSSIQSEKENIDKNLTATSNRFTECIAKRNELKTNNTRLESNILESQDLLKTSNGKLKQSEEDNKLLKSKKNDLEKDLKATMREKSEVENELKATKSEKSEVEKDLKASRFNLGECKNKNMKHEVANLELLQRIEGMEKELKAC